MELPSNLTHAEFIRLYSAHATSSLERQALERLEQLDDECDTLREEVAAYEEDDTLGGLQAAADDLESVTQMLESLHDDMDEKDLSRNDIERELMRIIGTVQNYTMAANAALQKTTEEE